MSEDEIIKNLNDLLEHNYLEDVGYLREENDYVVYNNAIQGLLDLYNIEKEKNRQSKMRIVQLEKEIDARIEDVNTYYINKDEIRAKIKELENLIETNSLYEECWNKIEVLKELLERR